MIVNDCNVAWMSLPPSLSARVSQWEEFLLELNHPLSSCGQPASNIARTRQEGDSTPRTLVTDGESAGNSLYATPIASLTQHSKNTGNWWRDCWGFFVWYSDCITGQGCIMGDCIISCNNRDRPFWCCSKRRYECLMPFKWWWWGRQCRWWCRIRNCWWNLKMLYNCLNIIFFKILLERASGR
jgi:hypothetical protein